MSRFFTGSISRQSTLKKKPSREIVVGRLLNNTIRIMDINLGVNYGPSKVGLGAEAEGDKIAGIGTFTRKTLPFKSKTVYFWVKNF